MAMQELYCNDCGAANTSMAYVCYYCSTPFSLRYSTHATGTLPGQTLLDSRYLLLNRVGQGGMGAVYKALDIHYNSRPLAIKEMSKAGLSPTDIQKAEAAFEHEATLLANLHHPNLPRIYDHFTEGDRSYLAMDFIEGETLEAYLEHAGGGPLPINQVIGWAVELCHVLGYLHTCQPPIVFRDLKPANVMISTSGHLFLIDFGIARVFKPGQSRDTVALGSPGYAAPEQYGRAQSTPRSDLYSLGALLHHLLSGIDPSEQPFSFAAISQLNRAVDHKYVTLIQHLLEMDPEKRPVNAHAVLNILDTTLHFDLDSALDAYEQACFYNPQLVSAWIGKGDVLYDMGRFKAAWQAYHEALNLDDTSTHAYYGIGNVLYAQQQLEQALKMFDKVLTYDVACFKAWHRQGNVLSDMGEFTKALNSYDQALHFNSDYALAWSSKGGVLRQLGRYPESLQAYERALKLCPDNFQVWISKGNVCYYLGDYHGALGAYEHSLLLHPQLASAWHNKSLALRRLSQYNEALIAAEEAVRLAPYDPDNWQCRADTLKLLRRRRDARLATREAARLRERNKLP